MAFIWNANPFCLFFVLYFLFHQLYVFNFFFILNFNYFIRKVKKYVTRKKNICIHLYVFQTVSIKSTFFFQGILLFLIWINDRNKKYRFQMEELWTVSLLMSLPLRQYYCILSWLKKLFFFYYLIYFYYYS